MDRLFFGLGAAPGSWRWRPARSGPTRSALDSRRTCSAVFETAARYQMYHALALLAVAWAADALAGRRCRSGRAGSSWRARCSSRAASTRSRSPGSAGWARSRRSAAWRFWRDGSVSALAAAAGEPARRVAERMTGTGVTTDTYRPARAGSTTGSPRPARRPGVIVPAAAAASPAATARSTSPLPTPSWSTEAVDRLAAAERARWSPSATALLDRMRAIEPDWSPPYDVARSASGAFDRLTDALAEEPCPLLDERAAAASTPTGLWSAG